MDNMENNALRTELDTIVNAFLLSKLSAHLFMSENLSALTDKSDKIERIESLLRYLKDNNHESVLKHFYEQQLQAIPIETNEFKLQKMKPLEKLEYLEILREEAFQSRFQELIILEKEVLPLYHTTYSNSNRSDDITVSNEQKGFDYRGSFSNIERFHKSLQRSGYIQVDYQEFKKFFQSTFIPNNNKVHWLTNINHLNYLIQKIRAFEKNVFSFDRSKYRTIIPLMFEYTPKLKKEKETLSEKILSQNNKIDFSTDLLDKAIAHLSKVGD